MWVIYTGPQQVHVYTADSHAIFELDDMLEGGNVLPGFTVKVSDLFPS